MKDYLRETIDIMNKVYGATATDAYSKAQASIIEKLKAQVEQLRECLFWCLDLHRFGHEIKDEDWDFIYHLLVPEGDEEE